MVESNIQCILLNRGRHKPVFVVEYMSCICWVGAKSAGVCVYVYVYGLTNIPQQATHGIWYTST